MKPSRFIAVIGCCLVIAAIAVFVSSRFLTSGTEVNPIVKTDWLHQEWVEIREENTGTTLVFRSVNSPIPPARGRRRLDLRSQGEAVTGQAGADDRLEFAEGEWSLVEQALTLSIPGWEGTYRIERLTEETLILERQ